MLFSSPALNDPPKSVLIVDDDAMIVELLAIGFEKYGFKVFKAGNGQEAWNLFSLEPTDFVLTDIQMPVMGGKELSIRIRNQSKTTRIAVMTGGKIDVAAGLVKKGIADYFFSKPFEIKRICKTFVSEAQCT